MNIWRPLGRAPPVADATQRAFYTKALQKLWVAGTLGAYFTALWRNAPDTIAFLSQGWPAFDDLIVVLLRYAYLLWLLFYFLASATNNEHAAAGRGGWDVVFDVAQSIGGLIAAFLLGFTGSSPKIGVTPYLVTNIVVLCICVASRWLFSESARAGVNRLRVWGAGISLVAALLCVALDFGRTLLLLLAACQLALLILLLFYLWICFNEPPRGEAAVAANTALVEASRAATAAAAEAVKATTALAKATRALAQLAK